MQVFQDSSCKTVSQTVPLGGAPCAAIQAAKVVDGGVAQEYVRYQPAGQCKPSGGVASGDVSPSQPVTGDASM